jgi:hypothetical protein
MPASWPLLLISVSKESTSFEPQTGLVPKAAPQPANDVSKACQLLPFVFAFAEAFEDGKAGLFGVGNGEALRRVERRPHFAHGFFARGAFGQGGGGERSKESESAAANFAVTVAEFVFVERHLSESKVQSSRSKVQGPKFKV